MDETLAHESESNRLDTYKRNEDNDGRKGTTACYRKNQTAIVQSPFIVNNEDNAEYDDPEITHGEGHRHRVHDDIAGTTCPRADEEHVFPKVTS
jgi:hypothetical protein